MGLIRILFLADTHLGYDLPFRPRIERRRRGEDFFRNYEKALLPAFHNQVDGVIHGGDLFFRSRIPARLVDMAFSPLKEVADRGVKVFLVPGNHERSRIPFGLLSVHPNIHIFSKPKTFFLEKEEKTVALSGFPYCRDNVRTHFSKLLEETGWREALPFCHASLLCVHHLFEGARVGPVNYTFRDGADVIRTTDIPSEFAAALAGHVHRFQVLRTSLNGLPLKTPVFYPGAIERTSFAEQEETKGFLILEIDPSLPRPQVLSRWHFCQLPARPMVKLGLYVTGLSHLDIRSRLKTALDRLDPESVVKVEICGRPEKNSLRALNAAAIRSLCPEGMNISLSFPGLFTPSGAGARKRGQTGTSPQKRRALYSRSSPV